MAKTIHFNTGRPYTAHGQRITATLHDDGVVTFYDHDRMVDGSFELESWLPLDRGAVMARYDQPGEYGLDRRRSWKDSAFGGGANAKYEGE